MWGFIRVYDGNDVSTICVWILHVSSFRQAIKWLSWYGLMKIETVNITCYAQFAHPLTDDKKNFPIEHEQSITFLRHIEVLKCDVNKGHWCYLLWRMIRSYYISGISSKYFILHVSIKIDWQGKFLIMIRVIPSSLSIAILQTFSEKWKAVLNTRVISSDILKICMNIPIVCAMCTRTYCIL